MKTSVRILFPVFCLTLFLGACGSKAKKSEGFLALFQRQKLEVSAGFEKLLLQLDSIDTTGFHQNRMAWKNTIQTGKDSLLAVKGLKGWADSLQQTSARLFDFYTLVADRYLPTYTTILGVSDDEMKASQIGELEPLNAELDSLNQYWMFEVQRVTDSLKASLASKKK